MCGIVGAIAFNDFAINKEYINPMRDSIAHRGPDGAGTWISEDQRLGLGHRRLAILDLTHSADQPMLSNDKSLALVFNGEIYNHQELRTELTKAGFTQWQTNHSDTEVILKAYQHWGIDCLQHFRGMFAFALWDNNEKTLWLVRDRLGIKPLYYSLHHNRLTFGSEIKALLEDKEQPREVNTDGFFHYLSFLTTPAPETLFKGIKKLPCGNYLKITSSGKIEQKRYWELYDHTKPLTRHSENEIAEMVQEELRRSVQLRKTSDRPVGVFLSGGIDSSTNAALFSENQAEAINTYSIGYDGTYDSYKNELDYAKSMADYVGANYHDKLLNIDDLIDFLPEMIYLQDEPIADPVCVPVYYVSQLARNNGTIVCQVGEGADELFWGYPAWKIKLRLQQLNQVPFTHHIKRFTKNKMEKMGHQNTHEFEFIRRAADKRPVFWGGAEAFMHHQKFELVSPRLRNYYENFDSWDVIEPIYKRFRENAWDKHPLNWMSYIDLHYRLPELLLMRVDKMSMGVSLEGRVPFLDHKFVELAMSIPAKLKTKEGNLKYILKKAVTGLIPDELIHRKKQGFGVPVYEWFADKLGDKIKTDFRSFCKKTDYFDPKIIDHYLDTGQAPSVWYLYNFVLWHEKFIG